MFIVVCSSKLLLLSLSTMEFRGEGCVSRVGSVLFESVSTKEALDMVGQGEWTEKSIIGLSALCFQKSVRLEVIYFPAFLSACDSSRSAQWLHKVYSSWPEYSIQDRDLVMHFIIVWISSETCAIILTQANGPGVYYANRLWWAPGPLWTRWFLYLPTLIDSHSLMP